MKYVVVGGAGAMGRITVRDLVETTQKKDEVVIADYDFEKARALAESFGDSRVTPLKVDVKNHDEAAEKLKGAFAVINSVQYQLNLDVMEIALKAGAHYVDLGGLFHVTKEQLKLNERFKEAGLTALLGLGAAPGITNILARHGVDQLDEVEEIHCRVAGMDKTKLEPKPALGVSYSLKTILEEFSFEPAVFSKGKMTFVKPMSGDVPHKFPSPVGVRKPMYTIHSEVATLPYSFENKGVKEVSFKIAFDPEFVDRVRFLRDLGMASHDLIDVNGCKVKPVDVVNWVAMNQPPTKQVGKLNQYEVVRTIVKGVKNKKKLTYILDCHTKGIPEWGLGLDVDTGCPPSIAAQMLAEGTITEKGTLPAEKAVPPKRFFEHLKKRKMSVKVQKLTGWGMKT